MIKAEIIADSINPVGNRLTSWILEYPRFVHAELMTHRAFSRNAASSRAIPIEKMIQQVIDNPAMPVWWGKNQSGMQAKEELNNTETKIFIDPNNPFFAQHATDLQMAKIIWLEARDKAIEYVKNLNKLGLHKQIANRILEPWFNIRVIVSATEFENWFALREHPDAQPEIQKLAEIMLPLYNASQPKQLQPGEWHIPFGDKFDDAKIRKVYNEIHKQPISLLYIGPSFEKWNEIQVKIAIARCARVSYFNFEGKDDYAADIKLCDRLFSSVPRHLSPTEHVAECLADSARFGNFNGFKQYRYKYTDQNLSDSRVVKK
jgi:thymidylate synthase ThyX